MPGWAKPQIKKISYLSGSIPEPKAVGLPGDHDVRGVVVKHRGDIIAGEAVGGVSDEEAALAHSPVADHHEFQVLHCW